MTPERPSAQHVRRSSSRARHGEPARPRGGTPRWLRVLLPAALILVWLALGGTGGPYFGKVSEVSSNDSSAYLPESAEATKVQALRGEFEESDAIPGILVFTSEADLTQDQLTDLGDALDGAVSSVSGVAEGSPVVPADDGQAAQAFVSIDPDAELGDVVSNVQTSLQESLPDGLEVYVTGPAGFSADLSEAFSGIDGLLLGVALAAVLVILIVVYRSFLLPIAVLGTSMFALCAALFVVWWLAKWDILLLSGQTQGILFILVIGAATDYSLLLVARFREELRFSQDKWAAVWKAVRGSFEPIVASGATVIAGLLCLLLSDLKSNSTLGPVAAIGIAFAMLSALTFLPAVLFCFGRAAFWPRMPALQSPTKRGSGDISGEGFWARWQGGIRRRPRRTWIITAALLLLGGLGILQLNASGVAQSDLVLGTSQARDGQEALEKHFPGGSGSPALVIVGQEQSVDAAGTLLENSGVEAVSVVSSASRSGTTAITEQTLEGAAGSTDLGVDHTVVQGKVLLEATLSDAADSDAAGYTVRDLRQSLAESASSAMVGGVTATAVDTNTASIHDRTLIIPVVLAVITLILMLLLRAVVAPLMLLLTTVLSFATAMGVSALVFNDLFGFPGADPAVPLFGFVFLVALGVDYNIFLMSRVREEALVHGTHDGLFRGSVVTGGVITSAGLVLAATFAALAVLPILFLVQLAVTVAFGVLLDTFVVRTLLVPALGYDLGRSLWWPAKLSREPKAPAKSR